MVEFRYTVSLVTLNSVWTNALKSPSSALSSEIHCNKSVNSGQNPQNKHWYNFCFGNTLAVSGLYLKYIKSIH